jgi:hypothetical protein
VKSVEGIIRYVNGAIGTDEHVHTDSKHIICSYIICILHVFGIQSSRTSHTHTYTHTDTLTNTYEISRTLVVVYRLKMPRGLHRLDTTETKLGKAMTEATSSGFCVSRTYPQSVRYLGYVKHMYRRPCDE